jgi:hypothetical protein
MKKHIDWKRIGWTVYAIGGSVLSVLCLYYFYAQNWTHKDYIQGVGITDVPATFESWWFSAFVGIFITFIFGVIVASITKIINYYYHNGAER